MKRGQKYFLHKFQRSIITMLSIIIAGVVGLFAQDGALFNTAPQTTFTREIAHVARVIDGDTIVLSDGRLVRYIGIDTPESSKRYTYTPECYAKEATKRNRTLVENKDVLLERDVSDTDQYNRLLRYVYVDNLFVNEILVAEGFAVARRYRPDTTYAKIFESAEDTARVERKGLWGICKS